MQFVVSIINCSHALSCPRSRTSGQPWPVKKREDEIRSATNLKRKRRIGQKTESTHFEHLHRRVVPLRHGARSPSDGLSTCLRLLPTSLLLASDIAITRGDPEEGGGGRGSAGEQTPVRRGGCKKVWRGLTGLQSRCRRSRAECSHPLPDLLGCGLSSAGCRRSP